MRLFLMQRIERQHFRTTLMLIGMVWLSACSGSASVGTATPSLPTVEAFEVDCHTAFRSRVTVPIEDENNMILSSTTREGTIVYADLVFHAQYMSEGGVDDLRSINLWVTPAGSNDPLMSVLYQLDKRPVNQMVGGHGFTGLHYVYHPETQAELQFWCSAR